MDNSEAIETVACPVCGSKPGQQCEYVEGAEHNGWVHLARLIPGRQAQALLALQKWQSYLPDLLATVERQAGEIAALREALADANDTFEAIKQFCDHDEYQLAWENARDGYEATRAALKPRT